MPLKTKRLNLALQGGGAHGAFTWGVLDRLLEDGRLAFDGLCGTSAGAMNAVVCAHGMQQGGRDGARASLEEFWRRVAAAGAVFSPVRGLPFGALFGGAWRAASHAAFDTLTRSFSPYQLNPLNFNPLRQVLEAVVDFDALKACDCVELFVCATNVRSGKPRIFRNREVSADAVLASACLPYLFQAVEIDGEAYWDGGYIGNPAIYPLIYETRTLDILIVHVNPIAVRDVPRTAAEILDRVNEISFNSSLVREMRAIAFVQKLIDDDWIKEQYKSKLRKLRMHALSADEDLAHLGLDTKLDPSWDNLVALRDKGRARAALWLAANHAAVGRTATVDLREAYL